MVDTAMELKQADLTRCDSTVLRAEIERQGCHICVLMADIERLRAALKALADRVEKVAFDMRPPNAHTPIFVALAQAARFEIAPRVDEQSARKEGE